MAWRLVWCGVPLALTHSLLSGNNNSFARQAYHIYRVFNAGNPDAARIVTVPDPIKLLRAQQLGLCLVI